METTILNFPNFAKKNKIDIIDNKNLDASCLNYKQLHLNRKGNSYLQNNFLDYLNCVWLENSFPVSSSSHVSSIKGLHSLRKQYTQNIIVSYSNINSIRNKLNNLKILISDLVGFHCITESKPNQSFLNSEIALKGFKKP